jgi:hypothetical protein
MARIEHQAASSSKAAGIHSVKIAPSSFEPSTKERSATKPSGLAFLNRSDKAVEHSGLSDDRRYLTGGLSQHADFSVTEGSCHFCLHDKHPLEDAAIDERYTQKGLVRILSRFAEVLEARMISGVFDGNREYLLRNEAGKTFVQRKTQNSDALPPQSKGCRQYEVRSIGFQKVCGADIRCESAGDERDHVHQSLSRFACLTREICEFFHREDVICFAFRLAHVLKRPFISRESALYADSVTPRTRTQGWESWRGRFRHHQPHFQVMQS